MSLDEVLARLARHVDVAGVVALGTTATGRRGPASEPVLVTLDARYRHA
jgi:hypothetical protein